MTTANIPQLSLKQYVKVARGLNQDRELTGHDRLVGFMLLDGYRVDWCCCAYKMQQIAEWLQMSERAVFNSIARLKERGHILVKKEFGRNKYIPKALVETVENDAKDCSDLASEDLNKDAGSRPEQTCCSYNREDSDSSSEESSSSYQEKQKEPTATPRGPKAATGDAPRSPVSPDRGYPSTWSEYERFVINKALPVYRTLRAGFDETRFKKVVREFAEFRLSKLTKWYGIKWADKCLRRWLSREWFKTENDYANRGYDPEMASYYDGV